MAWEQKGWEQKGVKEVLMELRPGEGGDDAKSLTGMLAFWYVRHGLALGIQVEVEEEASSKTVLRFSGAEMKVRGLLGESGGHRFQRVPPNDKRKRVHTSTVTVVALDVPREAEFKLKESEIETFTTKDSGPGGQHRNRIVPNIYTYQYKSINYSGYEYLIEY